MRQATRVAAEPPHAVHYACGQGTPRELCQHRLRCSATKLISTVADPGFPMASCVVIAQARIVLQQGGTHIEHYVAP